MSNSEIQVFIEKMQEYGDEWDIEAVKRVYGDMSLDEALQDRISDLHWFADIISKVINR